MWLFRVYEQILLPLFRNEIKHRSDLPETTIVFMFMLLTTFGSALFLTLPESHLVSCVWAIPLGSILKALAKHITWYLFLVRGRLVSSYELIEKLKYGGYIVAVQCVGIMILVLCVLSGDNTTYGCSVTLPWWLPSVGCILGEIFYGWGFFYLFHKGFSGLLNKVQDSLSTKAIHEEKIKIRRHQICYAIQMIFTFAFLIYLTVDPTMGGMVMAQIDLVAANITFMYLFNNLKRCGHFKNKGETSKTGHIKDVSTNGILDSTNPSVNFHVQESN